MKILAFGIVKEIFDNSFVNLDIKDGDTIDTLRNILEKKYPGLNELGSYMIAINNEYATGKEVIHEGDELAIIPPVSGG